MMEIEWTNDQVLTLVNEYKNRRMLWDPNHDMYRVQTAKYEAWCELADIFECEIPDLRKKFNSIFASHRREKSKVRLGGRSTWFLYNHLSFLPNHIECDELAENTTVVKKRKKKEIVEEPEDEESDDEYEANGDESPVHIVIKEEQESIERTPPKIKYVCSKPRLTRVIKRRIVKDNTLADRNKFLERKLYKRSNLYKKKDECDSFGEYIAISLRKHDERTRSMIKQAINNILFEQEMKKYNNSAQYAVVISNMDENPLIIGDECEK
ncbi:uncharacterized protein LOC124536782 [Vanessa cardui]|uniref:uncharacterized protein LOC124536782 n=1 Tax=Vanessa cardui TaxID=171605 RepID=UPI001F12AD3B|nr:uncharacterized protein LOC124536782 [Vanessa cardui]